MDGSGHCYGAFLVAQTVKNLSVISGNQVYPWVGKIPFRLLGAHKSQANVACFSVLLSPFPEKAFCIKSHGASLPQWVVSHKLSVSVCCWPQGLQPCYPSKTSLCFLSHQPVSQHFLFGGDYWGTWGSSGAAGR